MVFAYDFRPERIVENLLTITSWVLYSAAFICQGVSLVSNHWITIKETELDESTRWESINGGLWQFCFTITSTADTNCRSYNFFYDNENSEKEVALKLVKLTHSQLASVRGLAVLTFMSSLSAGICARVTMGKIHEVIRLSTIFFVLFSTSCFNAGSLVVYMCCYDLRMETDYLEMPNSNDKLLDLDYRFGHGFYLSVASVVLYFLTGLLCVYHAACNSSIWEATTTTTQRPTAIESESSHEAHMAKQSDTEIPAYLVRQTRTPSVFTMDSPEGRQKMLGFGKEARHIFHGPAPRSLSQRSMSVDFVSMNMNRRRKASFPTDLTQITEELDEEYRRRISDRTNKSNRSFFDDFAEEDETLA